MHKLSVGIIPDGNRRYAKSLDKSALWGHEQGFENLKRIISYIITTNSVEDLAIYALSTENWKRDKKEIRHLMFLFEQLFLYAKNFLDKQDVKIKIVGDKQNLSDDIKSAIENIEKLSQGNKKMTLWIALSYGGKTEIKEAAQKALAHDAKIETAEDFKRFMWSADLPDFDIVIRTGGEKRLSNFFLWQSAYAELFFFRQILARV